ncbi:SusD/RagB family nutrient-binding outer membrane lipoprotein [Fulvivirga sp. M361]|uniref:SusD/RagB family nutrient-binding outer membrane lipoprotein n=1 Tax=Fulvivirga sp. M361 TaxID=2594266 RepID=UPI00117B5F88|nr:SusD/RagB family nutrient-binding outer membrane lipoprotein [Fulvivirga sp. M361]TRX62207.1 SusD/RagB family nutrient-binding outer membrane lipoprotein [Fulvivirga sp. M361]
MKNIYYYFIALTSTIVFSACEDNFLDVNDSPNAGVVADANVLFTGAIVEQINNRTQYLQQYGNYYTQHYYSGNDSGFLTDWERYRQGGVLLSIWSGNFWNSYTNITSLKLAEDEALATGFLNTAAQAKILQAEIYLELSLLHERIPFTESNTIGINNPNFDDQEDVFNGVIDILDSAASIIDVTTGGQVQGGDLLYSGNMTAWLKFANSLKFKVLMLKANADPGAAAEIASFMATDPRMFENNGDDAKVDFLREVGNQNPGWRLFDAFGAWNFQDETGDETEKDGKGFAMYLSPISKSIFENYTSIDPRLNLLFRQQRDTLEYLTIDLNENSDDDVAYIDENIYQEIYPDYFMTYSDVQLLKAEAIIKNYIPGTPEEAQTAYENGAKASIERYNALGRIRNADQAAIDAYMAALPMLSAPTTTTNATTALEHIYLQQYADSYLRGLHAWTNWRRTDYPVLEAHEEGSVGGIIKRWPYDTDEPAINVNFPPSVPGLGEAMWFEN